MVPPSTASRSDIRLVIVDIDGTISGHSNQVSPGVKQALQEARRRGIHVGIATGRMYRSAVRFHGEIQANLPICAYQGALIRHPEEDRTYKHWLLDRGLAQHLMDQLADHPLLIHVYIDDELYLKELTPLSQAYAARSQVPVNLLADLGPTLTLEPTKVLAMAEDEGLIDRLLTRMRQIFPVEQLYLTRSVPTFLEATHPAVNKGNAVRYLAEEILGLTADQVMTIGDSDNDIEMLSYAGIGVAMGNASDPIKGYANWVAPSVEEDGVAAALEEFVFR